MGAHNVVEIRSKLEAMGLELNTESKLATKFEVQTEAVRVSARKKTSEPTKNGQLRGLREASAGFEPAMVDLQSTALATWPRRRHLKPYGSVKMRTVK